MEIVLQKNFKKADYESLPIISSEMLFNYITKFSDQGNRLLPTPEDYNEKEWKVDYVQIKKSKFNTEIKAMYFKPVPKEKSSDKTDIDNKFRLQLNLNEAKNEVISLKCEDCEENDEDGLCAHALGFLFWMHKKITDSDADTDEIFWPGERIKKKNSENEVTSTDPAIQMKNIFLVDETLVEGLEEVEDFTQDEGKIFLNNILDEMEKVGLNECSFYKHCRTVFDEFEPIYIHHTMLDNANNYVKDFKSFITHMENHGTLFDKFTEASVTQYKKQQWIEAQYGRIRCSLMHKIFNRTDSSEDNAILDTILCQNREWNVEDRKQLKEHKRFILKQAEKLENKSYKRCGLLLSENYPYICAAPDGITDDHVVEIKAPKTDEEFEKYLVGKETIAPKYMSQIQIQMYLANVSKALYCVLSPSFDTNGALHYVWVQVDMEMVAGLLGAAEDYWKDIVFPRLKKIYIDE